MSYLHAYFRLLLEFFRQNLKEDKLMCLSAVFETNSQISGQLLLSLLCSTMLEGQVLMQKWLQACACCLLCNLRDVKGGAWGQSARPPPDSLCHRCFNSYYHQRWPHDSSRCGEAASAGSALQAIMSWGSIDH